MHGHQLASRTHHSTRRLFNTINSTGEAKIFVSKQQNFLTKKGGKFGPLGNFQIYVDIGCLGQVEKIHRPIEDVIHVPMKRECKHAMDADLQSLRRHREERVPFVYLNSLLRRLFNKFSNSGQPLFKRAYRAGPTFRPENLHTSHLLASVWTLG